MYDHIAHLVKRKHDVPIFDDHPKTLMTAIEENLGNTYDIDGGCEQMMRSLQYERRPRIFQYFCAHTSDRRRNEIYIAKPSHTKNTQYSLSITSHPSSWHLPTSRLCMRTLFLRHRQ
jgi:hypothetical protein